MRDFKTNAKFLAIGLLQVRIALSSLSISAAVNAQVTPDGTTSTTVDADGNNFTINEGDLAGDNLFHSFERFFCNNWMVRQFLIMPMT